jgi:hypothetical protein
MATDQITITSLSFDNISIETSVGGVSGKYLTIHITGAGANSGTYKLQLYDE